MINIRQDQNFLIILIAWSVDEIESSPATNGKLAQGWRILLKETTNLRVADLDKYHHYSFGGERVRVCFSRVSHATWFVKVFAIAADAWEQFVNPAVKWRVIVFAYTSRSYKHTTRDTLLYRVRSLSRTFDSISKHGSQTRTGERVVWFALRLTKRWQPAGKLRPPFDDFDGARN